MAWATWGAASAAGTAVGTAIGGTAGTIATGAVTAAVSTLSTQAAIALVNARGDIGQALHTLGSSANVRALVTAMVTGGVLAGLDLGGARAAQGTPQVAGGAQTFGTQLWQNVQTAGVRTLISTAINGGSFEQNLRGALTAALIDTAAAQGAFAIGEAGPGGSQALNAFTAEFAHAIAGCMAGAARAATTQSAAGAGCSAGAIGAVAGHLGAKWIDPDAVGGGATVQFATMMAGFGAALTGADARGIDIAAQAGGNAAANNWLQPRERQLRDRAQRQCEGGDAGACSVVQTLNQLDQSREDEQRGTLGKGIRDGLIGLLMSPVTMPVELVASLADKGAQETALNILRGVAELPQNIVAGLNSADPEERGRAIVQAAATVTGGAALVRAGVRAAVPAANGSLVSELAGSGVKFSPDKLVAIAKTPDGRIVFLETGDASSGLQHIMTRHGNELLQFGITEAQVPSLVMRTLTEGRIVGYQGTGTGRPIYEVTFNGQPVRLAITVGSNGYVVGLNIASRK